MCASVLDGEHLNDGNTGRKEDKVQHVGKGDRRHSQRGRMHRPMMTAAPWGCSRPCPGSIIAIRMENNRVFRKYQLIANQNKKAKKVHLYQYKKSVYLFFPLSSSVLKPYLHLWRVAGQRIQRNHSK